MSFWAQKYANFLNQKCITWWRSIKHWVVSRCGQQETSLVWTTVVCDHWPTGPVDFTFRWMTFDIPCDNQSAVSFILIWCRFFLALQCVGTYRRTNSPTDMATAMAHSNHHRTTVSVDCSTQSGDDIFCYLSSSVRRVSTSICIQRTNLIAHGTPESQTSPAQLRLPGSVYQLCFVVLRMRRNDAKIQRTSMRHCWQHPAASRGDRYFEFPNAEF